MAATKLRKSSFDVLRLCCSSEIPMIEKVLKPLQGVKDVSVIVASRTVIVVHDELFISQLQIVNALNRARLEANVSVNGGANHKNKWPSPFTIACGVFLMLSFLKYVYHPLQWLAIASVLFGIYPILEKGYAALRNFTLDTNILVLIAVIGSIALHDYWEAGSIVFLFTIAQWLESRASYKARAVMSSLMNMVPQKAVLAETGEEIDVSEVMVNTILAVKPGEDIPIDGIVVHGNCEVDEKTLTGESFPVSKQTDSIVWAGTINLNGCINVKTTALAEDCVVAKMAKLVEEAEKNKSKTQRFIDKCAKYYTPAIVGISIGLAAIPAILRVHNLKQWFHLALVVLVSACPCALILSTPVATFCALSKAATSGLLIKGGEYLETLAKIKVIGFDKTGTITRGEFVVTEFKSVGDGVSLNTLVYWVSSIESKSSHPMAVALIDYGRSLHIEPKPDNVKNFENFPGEGIHGKIDGKDIYVGNRKMASRAGCDLVPSLDGTIGEGKSIGYIFMGKVCVGIFSLSDTCRSGAKEAIVELKSMGIRTAMLTGDSNEAATKAQNQLKGAFDIVHSELLPQDKANIIKDFQNESPTAMVGDGLNDAPALATANIGISMGISGSALATETGHIILMSNDVRKIPQVVKLARKTRTKIIQNVVLSISTKAAIIGLAIAGHPLVWAAVLADVGTCLVVIFNSMLLLKGTEKEANRHCESLSKICFWRRWCSSSHSHHHSCDHSHEHKHEHSEKDDHFSSMSQSHEKPCCGHNGHSKNEEHSNCNEEHTHCDEEKSITKHEISIEVQKGHSSSPCNGHVHHLHPKNGGCAHIDDHLKLHTKHSDHRCTSSIIEDTNDCSIKCDGHTRNSKIPSQTNGCTNRNNEITRCTGEHKHHINVCRMHERHCCRNFKEKIIGGGLPEIIVE